VRGASSRAVLGTAAGVVGLLGLAACGGGTGATGATGSAPPGHEAQITGPLSRPVTIHVNGLVLVKLSNFPGYNPWQVPVSSASHVLVRTRTGSATGCPPRYTCALFRGVTAGAAYVTAGGPSGCPRPPKHGPCIMSVMLHDRVTVTAGG
jgi:hypothetical protein